MAIKAEDITQEQFDSKLEEILDQWTGAHLLTIPGVYEVLSEEFNNQVIDEILNEGDADSD